MNQSDFETIYTTSRRLVRETTTGTKRFLLESIDWNNRLIGILGSRGTGKTTLILQHIKESFADISVLFCIVKKFYRQTA